MKSAVKRFFLKILTFVVFFIIVCILMEYADYSEKCDICGADAPFEICVTGHRVTKTGSMLEKVCDTVVDFMRDNEDSYHFCATHYGEFIEWQMNTASR